MPRKVSVPKNALTLHETDNDDSYVRFSQSGEDDENRAQMLAYSGKVIKKHWYWGDLVINVSGISFSKPRIPILEDHDSTKKIGFAKKPNTDGNQILFEDITLLDNPAATEFKNNSKQGFPYQASIRANPTKILRLGDGESAEVNGFTFTGPGTIWEKSVFRESSVCVFGWDDRTKSSAFAKDGEQEVLELESVGGFVFDELESETPKEDTVPFDFNALKKEHPEDYEAFVKGIRDEVTDSLSKQHKDEMAAKDEEIAQLSQEHESTSEALKQSQEAFKALDRKVTLLSEQNLDAQAKEIWETALSDDDCMIPPHLHSKIRNQVKRTEFMNDDGEFDEKAFSEAVQAEIKEWSDGLPKDTKIKGSGAFSRTPEGGDSGEDDDDECAKKATSMARHLPGHNKNDSHAADED